jgi:glucose/arabinose dehydrogenase
MAVQALNPDDFNNELVLSGLNQPVSMTTLPDGRILILEKAGTIKITDPSAGSTSSAGG